MQDATTIDTLPAPPETDRDLLQEATELEAVADSQKARWLAGDDLGAGGRS